MANKKLEQLILQLENYSECWKQFIRFVNIGRSKKFSPDDENQFLELKCIMTQELELILAEIDVESPTKEEVISLISSVPSIKYISDIGEGAIRGIENQWHRIFIAWQSNLGQLKVQQCLDENKGRGKLSKVFSGRT